MKETKKSCADLWLFAKLAVSTDCTALWDPPGRRSLKFKTSYMLTELTEVKRWHTSIETESEWTLQTRSKIDSEWTAS